MAAQPQPAAPATRALSEAEGPAPASDHAEVMAAQPGTSVMFTQNVRQFDVEACFQVWGGPGTMWLAEDAISATVVDTSPHPPGPPSPLRIGEGKGETGSRGEVHAVSPKLTFPGANRHPYLKPVNRLDAILSYFIRQNPDQWHPDVPVWGGVRYKALYLGTDLEITRQAGRWSWRMVARGDAAGVGAVREPPLLNVRLRVEGADTLTLEPPPSPAGGRGAGGEGHRPRLTTAAGDFTLPLLATGRSAAPAAIADHHLLRPLAAASGFPAGQPTIRSPDDWTTRPEDNADDLLYSASRDGAPTSGARTLQATRT